jgi:hypothetical protein
LRALLQRRQAARHPGGARSSGPALQLHPAPAPAPTEPMPETARPETAALKTRDWAQQAAASHVGERASSSPSKPGGDSLPHSSALSRRPNRPLLPPSVTAAAATGADAAAALLQGPSVTRLDAAARNAARSAAAVRRAAEVLHRAGAGIHLRGEALHQRPAVALSQDPNRATGDGGSGSGGTQQLRERRWLQRVLRALRRLASGRLGRGRRADVSLPRTHAPPS